MQFVRRYPYLGTRFLQTLVNSDTGTQNRCDGVECALLGDASDMCGFGNAVLLEGTIHGVAGEKRFWAKGLIG